VLARIGLTLLLVSAWALPARAQDAKPEPAEPKFAKPEPVVPTVTTGYIGGPSLTPEVDNCKVPKDLSRAERRKRASEHYQRGQTLYDQGDYDGAIVEFSSAYCEAPNYKVLHEIAMCFERQVEYEKAVAYFSRYILESPPDLIALRDRTSFRVQVLSNLPARVKVATVPSGATVTLAGETGINALGTANDDKPIEVRKGTYEMRVEMAGYEPVSEEIQVQIGQPYSYYYRLEPKKGTLRVTTNPSAARIFVDNRLAGIGQYVEQLPIGRHNVTVEAPGRDTATREFEISAGRTTDLRIELPRPPRSGRRELMLASTIAGAVYGGGAFTKLFGEQTAEASAGVLVGLGLGFAGSYLGVPTSIRVGTSSYIIGAALIAAAEGAAISSFWACDPSANSRGQYEANCDAEVLSGAALAAAVGGTLAAVATSNRFELDAGDAAIINSGALWGGISAALFVAVFDSDGRLWAPLESIGLNLGVVSGVLLARRMEVSRGHVALIDMSGLAGMVAGVALVNVIEPGSEGERLPHFALIGMTAGLVSGAYLTRNMDDPKSVPMRNVKPQVSAARDVAGNSTMTFGLGASF